MWVDDLPDYMEAGTLYVSVKHRLTEHYCACGCGAEVSLPLGTSEWKLVYDGDSVSIWPSVGNWRLRCKSHYRIEANKTIWCPRWAEQAIVEGRRQDRNHTLLHIRRKNRNASWIGRLMNRLRWNNSAP